MIFKESIFRVTKMAPSTAKLFSQIFVFPQKSSRKIKNPSMIPVAKSEKMKITLFSMFWTSSEWLQPRATNRRRYQKLRILYKNEHFKVLPICTARVWISEKSLLKFERKWKTARKKHNFEFLSNAKSILPLCFQNIF